MNIKLLTTVGFLALCMMLPLSCSEDILDQANPNEISTVSFWRNAEDANLAVNGMYHPITGTFHWGRITHVGAMLRSDAMNIIPSNTNTTLSTLQGVPGVARWAVEPYQESYKAIFRANAILENVDDINVPDATERNNIIGQAYFFRAFTYFYLVNMYGNVPAGMKGGIPLVTKTPDPTNNDELFPTQATAQAVWDQIISDLAEAETRLPDAWSGDDLGRPTKWSAAALRGKSHLYRSGILGVNEYTDAATAFQSVVASGNYSLLPLSQYGENFSQVNENNAESVFELQFHPIGDGNFVWGQDAPGTGTQGNFVIEYAPPSQTPDNGHIINPWVKDLFESNEDTGRRNSTLAYDYPGSIVNTTDDFTDGLAADIAIVDALNDMPENAGLESVFSRKYSGLELPVGGTGFLGDNYGPNWRIIRYSDVLLMLAEALNEGNNTGEAEGFVNMVRNRAEIEPLSGLDQSGMREAIIDERVLELTGEGHRFFDLVRWGLAEKYLGENSAHAGPHPKSISGGTFTPGRDEVIWIPQSEIQANVELSQNPGY